MRALRISLPKTEKQRSVDLDKLLAGYERYTKYPETFQELLKRMRTHAQDVLEEERGSKVGFVSGKLDMEGRARAYKAVLKEYEDRPKPTKPHQSPHPRL